MSDMYEVERCDLLGADENFEVCKNESIISLVACVPSFIGLFLEP